MGQFSIHLPPVRLSKELMERIKTACQGQGETVSDFVRKALEQAVSNGKPKGDGGARQ